MSKTALGRFKQVELRAQWEHEGHEFTPWLAEVENLSLLGEAIGIELECVSKESSVGPFRADILCRDAASGSYVLIENQLEKTDHLHLGQILTYASGLDAATVVWVARRFTDEHRAVLDWLNRITEEKFAFFGVELELWRIDNSLAAPRFNVVSRPNDWVRATSVAAKATEGGNRYGKLYDYWVAFVNFVERNKRAFVVPKACAMPWLKVGIGSTDVYAVVSYSVGRRVGKIFVMFNDASIYQEYFAEREEIGRALKDELRWSPDYRNGNFSMVSSRFEDSKSGTQQSYEWFVKKLTGLHQIVSSRK